jgi:hypothetical protein
VTYPSAIERLREAALRFADVDSEAKGDLEFRRRDDDLRKAAVYYVLSTESGRAAMSRAGRRPRRRAYASVGQ